VHTTTLNGEKEVKLHSIIVHETQTGYAQCFKEDAYSKVMGEILLEDIIFSDEVRADWGDSELYEKLKKGEQFVNPKEV
jgi:6-pyruvoyltetrahydropterin/6-carboxytetrahydropterin synthase